MKSYCNKFKNKVSLLAMLILVCFISKAQTITPSTINISGHSASFDNYQFEWSVGESASIITTSNGNLIVSTGVLQSFVANSHSNTAVITWLPYEIKVYPNPTKDFIEINILHNLKGTEKLVLYDVNGRKLMEKQFEYSGSGRIEKWDLSKLAAGSYFLNIIQVNSASGIVIKNGSFKIQKIQ
jgi:hypothetical protein